MNCLPGRWHIPTTLQLLHRDWWHQNFCRPHQQTIFWSNLHMYTPFRTKQILCALFFAAVTYMRIYQGCWLVSGFINDWASFYDKKLSLLIVWIHNYLFRVIFVGVLHRQHKISDFSRNQISCEWNDLIKMCFVIFSKVLWKWIHI